MFLNEHNSPEKPLRRLFGRIIRRLKLEKSLKVFKGKFSISLAVLAVSAMLIIASVILLKLELAESESGSFISLLFSDIWLVIAYFQYFILAVLESIPVVSINMSLSAILILMVSLRLVINYYDKILSLKKLINPSLRKTAEGK